MLETGTYVWFGGPAAGPSRADTAFAAITKRGREGLYRTSGF